MIGVREKTNNEQLSANKFKNTVEMDTLLVRQDDLTDQRRKNLNGHTTLKDTESAVWNLPTKKILDPNSFKSEVYFKSKKKF